MLKILKCISLVVLVDIVQGQSPQCNLDTYSSPYIKLQKKRNGAPIEERYSKEFMDLRGYIHMVLCLNGPVIIYEEFEQSVNNFGDVHEKRIKFTNARIQIFSHECRIINQITTAAAMRLRANKITKPTLKDVSPGDITNGTKYAGVFLLANEGDYNKPVATFLTNDNLEFTAGNDSQGIESGSFVTVGGGPFCLRVDDKFDIIVAGIPSDNAVCRWFYTENFHDLDDTAQSRYKKIFDGNRRLANFAWTECGDTSGLGPFPGGGGDKKTENVTYDPFAIIDPSFFSSKLSFDFFESRKLQRQEDTPAQADLPGKFNNIGGSDDGDYDEENPADLVLPVLPENCILIAEKPTNPPDGCGALTDDEACTLMHAVLGIPPEEEEGNVTDTSGVRMLDKDLEWKRDILYLISDIFGHLCEPFPPDMAFTVGRVLEHYVRQAHDENVDLSHTPKDVWKYLTGELSRCMVNVRKSKYHFLWYWDNRDDKDAYGPDEETSNNGQFLDFTGGSPYCKAVECSRDCMTVDEKCVLTPEVADLCTNLGVDDCDLNKTLCMINEVENICELMIECEVGKCQGNSDTDCVPDGDTCIESEEASLSRMNKMNDMGNGGGMGLGQPDSDLQFDGAKGLAATGTGGGGTPVAPAPPPFTKIPVQEVFEVVKNRDYHFQGYPVNVLAITSVVSEVSKRRKRSTKKSTMSKKIESKRRRRQLRRRKRSPKNDNNLINSTTTGTVIGECLFYYEDMAETDYELNIAIDIYWKIFATVIGYCNTHYSIRKSETFPRLYNMFYEDFFELVLEEWKYPKSNEALKSLLGEWNSETSQKWLDVCLETSYIVANSSTYRPPRPLTIGTGAIPESNYFMQLPDYNNPNAHTIKGPDIKDTCPE